MRLLGNSSPRPMQSPRRVILLVCAVAFWLTNILLIFNHQLAVEKLPDTAPAFAPDGIVYQSTDYSCGPASLATIFRHFKVIKSEREWGELAGTNISVGTTLAGLRKAGEDMGLDVVEMSPTFDQLDLISWPAVVFQSRIYHLVTFWGLDETRKMIIRDPARGILRWDSSQYEFNTPEKLKMLVFYPGRVPVCDGETSPIEIGRFQNMLSSLGYYRGDIDGGWSRGLSDAIGKFQRDMDLERTGIADPATSIYMEGAWHLVSNGPIEPFMQIDRRKHTTVRSAPILSYLTQSDE